MKRLLITAAFLIGTYAANAQTSTSPEVAPLDSLTKLAQRYINAEQADSLYALMGSEFRKQISPDQLKQVVTQVHGQLGNWTGSEFKMIKDGIAKYRAVFALSPVDFYISRDKQGKVQTFVFQPAKE